MWALGIIAIFLALAYIGRRIRLGKWQGGAWFKQFRAVRGILGLLLMMTGIFLMSRGLFLYGLAAIMASMAMSMTVRIHTRFGSRTGAPPAAAAFSQEEIAAYRTLGLGIGANRKSVVEAWKGLMKTAHPDQGGSLERAKTLNAARDLLLKRRL